MLRHARAGAIGTGRPAAAMEVAPAAGRLWVADAAGDGVSVIDLAARRTVARLRVPGGAGAIAFAGRHHAVVTSAARGGTATLVDARRHRVVGTVTLGARPAAVDFAPAAQAFVVGHADGRLTTLPLSRGRLGRPQAVRVGPTTAGTGAVRVAPDGRTAVALNARADTIAIVDVARRRLVQTAEAGAAPAEVAFLDHFALARNARSPEVTWVDLDVPSRSNNIRLGSAPGRGMFADVTGDQVLVPSAADRQLYRVHAMHGRPMVMGQVPNPARADAGVTSKGGLQRTGPGRYELRTLIPDAGRYRLTVRLRDGERVEFPLAVESPETSVRARSARSRLRARPGEPLTVRFDVTGASPARADVLAYASSSGTIHQARAAARHIGGTSYEATLRLPDPGSYRLTLIAERGLPTKSEDLGAIVTVAAGRGG
jgi:DNA-binding beta-propeller fold protein YncE